MSKYTGAQLELAKLMVLDEAERMNLKRKVVLDVKVGNDCILLFVDCGVNIITFPWPSVDGVEIPVKIAYRV